MVIYKGCLRNARVVNFSEDLKNLGQDSSKGNSTFLNCSLMFQLSTRLFETFITSLILL